MNLTREERNKHDFKFGDASTLRGDALPFF
jgi:hypothetical protein